jgi:hypothetical protein
MSRDTRPHAVVMGDWQGALVTAAALRAANWDVTVYEDSLPSQTWARLWQ